jgi:Protein of unknown function (DUF3501)
MSTVTPRKLTLADVADLRAYERERPDFLARVIELKRRRRVAVGPIVTVLFENRDTVRFQIQEMARVEKLISDDAIQSELDVYNPLIPEPGQLAATMFIELTSDEALREWLPRLVGVERDVELRLPDDSVARAVTEEEHAARLTRDDVTSTVHYIRFELTRDQAAALAGGGPVRLAISHPAYQASVELDPMTMAELAADVAG